MNIAFSHVLLSSPANALALFARAESLAAKAIPAASPSVEGPPKLDISVGQAKALHSALQSSIAQYRGLVELQKHSSSVALQAQKNTTFATPTVEKLHEYPPNGVDLHNLVTYPPKLQPVPVKPLFLDVAWNYIEYPGQTKAEAPAPASTRNVGKSEEKQEEKPAKRGWFGFGR